MIFGWLRCRGLLQIELDRGSEYFFFRLCCKKGKQLKRSVGNSSRRGRGELEGYALSDSLVSWQIFAHLPGLFVSSFEALHEPSKCCQRTYLSGLACLPLKCVLFVVCAVCECVCFALGKCEIDAQLQFFKLKTVKCNKKLEKKPAERHGKESSWCIIAGCRSLCGIQNSCTQHSTAG